MSPCSGYLPLANPRIRSCARCGLDPKHHLTVHPAAEYMDEPRTRPRNQQRERMLVDLAARAAGLSGDAGLWEFADARTAPGGVREELDARQEIAEEVADGVNYATWGIERVYDRMLEGDSEATTEYEKYMRCLSHLVAAWDALVRG